MVDEAPVDSIDKRCPDLESGRVTQLFELDSDGDSGAKCIIDGIDKVCRQNQDALIVFQLSEEDWEN